MAEKKVIELEVKTESLKPLKAQLREAQAEVTALAEKFGATSQEAVNAAKKAAELKDAIADAKALTDAYNPDAKFNALSSAIGGVLNGFQAFEGALGLVGVEGKAVEETLLKVQSAMALTQGINGVLEAKEDFARLGKQIGDVYSSAVKGFQNMTAAGKAFAVTGIGLLITGLGLVIAYWDDIKKAVGGVSEEEKKLADFRRKHEQERRDFVANESKDFASSLAQLKATNKGSKERSELITEINQKYGTTLKNLSDEAAFQNQINKELENYLKYQTAKFKLQANEEAIVQNLKTQSKLRQEIAQSEKDLAKAIQEGAGKTRRTLEDGVLTTVDVNEQASITAEKAAKKIRESEKALADAEKRFENYGKAALKAGDDIAKLTNNGKKYVEQNKEVVTKTKEATEELKRNADEGVLKLDTQKAEEIELVKNSEEAKYNYLVYWGDLTNDYFKEQQEKRRQEQERNRKFALDSISQGLQIMDQLAEQSQKKYEDLNKAVLDNDKLTDKEKQRLLDENNKRAKKAFEIQKAVSIASALITTYQSAVSAYQSQFLPLPDPSSPIRGAVAAGLAIAAGLANVKQIASQKFEGASLSSSSSGGGGGVPSGAGGSVISPNFNIVGNAQATNPLAGLGNQPIQAYVVSGEVTTAQNLDRNRINYATFG
jgi:hypothetical protein